ncbi:MAG TPA: oligosaccharide flippase family protein [Fibrobacteria bacterium]|nr:oligosaccharide flippase family protein [Fibrobacteria bacterium]HOX50666.1 oligosaccharide flippase family protein [Fibrobacteria bacterium]
MGLDFLRGAGATLVSEAVGRGAAMGFQLLVANQLGADRFGLVALALASAALLSPLADTGLPNLALRTVSADPDDSFLARRLLGLKVLATPLFLLPLVVWSLLAGDREERGWTLLWAGAFYGFQASSDLLRQILRARQQAGRELVARLAYPLGNLASLAAVWHLKPGPSGALLALASGPAALTLAYVLALPSGERAPAVDRSALELASTHRRTLVQSVLYLFAVGFASRVDAFLLERWANREEVGRYFASLNLVMAGGFFAQGMSSYLYPRLHRQKARLGRALARAVGLQMLMGAALGAGAALVGPILFQMVFREKGFHGAESLLPGMGAMLFLTTMDWLWLSILIGKDRIWIAALVLVPSLVAKVLLGAWWIPSAGAAGMVHAALAAQLVGGGLGAWCAVRAYLKESSPRAG